MKTDFKLSGKMTLFIIISCVIVVASVVVGVVCSCLGYGYFNAGADWNSDKTVTLTWYYVDGFHEKDSTLMEYCEKAFEDEGVSYYAVSYGTADDGSGGDITYTFTYSTDTDALEAACDTIRTDISGMFPPEYKLDEDGNTVTDANGEAVVSYQDVYLTKVYSHVTETYAGSSKALIYASIAVATVIVFELLYVMIRYKISMALGGFLACIHNLALYICLVALCRIPVGTSMFAFAVLTVVVTMICTLFMYGKMRRNIKDETLADLTPAELTDRSASESFKVNLGITASLAAAVVVMFVLMSISSLSVLAIISPVLCALVAFVSCFYGTCFFLPSVYPRFRKIGLRFQRKKKPSSKKAADKANG
ncbi:MAG: hypothetical protein LUD50_03770 [Clostridia bacterium]|nr:hypothetical protein [Clostridia bacterium]